MGKHGRSSTQKKTWLYVAIGAVVVLVAAAAAWALLPKGPNESATVPQNSLAETTETVESTESVEPSGSVEPTVPAEPIEPSEEPVIEQPTGDAAPVYDPNATPETVSQQPGRLVGVKSVGGTYRLSIDYILFLTGGEAADAAAAHGDESPPPNDYYIVNDNPTVREFPIAPNLSVRVVTNADGTSNPTGYTMSVKDWAAAVNGPAGKSFKAGIYYITLADGTVTMIEQLYLP